MQGDTPPNWPPKSSTQPERKFIPLGGAARLPPKKAFPGGLGQPSQSDIVTASFLVVDQPKTVPVKLPDIYTTCPELRNFKPLMTLPGVGTLDTPVLESTPKPASSSSSGSKFDPDKQILRPYVFALRGPLFEWSLCAFYFR